MKNIVLLAAALLAATTSVALPTRESWTPQAPNPLRVKLPPTAAARVQHRRRKPTLIRPGANLNNIKSTTFNATFPSASTTTPASLISPNWSGAVASPPSPTANFTSIGGRIVVPSIRRPFSAASNSTSTYSAAAWVGIDGDTNPNALLQTGITFSIDPSGTVTYGAWWEWYPYAAQFYDNFTMQAGDVIQMNATAQSATEGLMVLENLTNGDRAETSMALPADSGVDLTGANVEWIVEDFEVGSELVPVGDWEAVTFSETWWEGAEGGQGNAVGAEVWNLEGREGEVLSDVVIEEDGRVVDYYVEK